MIDLLASGSEDAGARYRLPRALTPVTLNKRTGRYSEWEEKRL